MKLLISLIFCTIVLGNSSCSYRPACEDPEWIGVRFSGFDSTELSHVIINKFEYGKGFTHPTASIDTNLSIPKSYSISPGDDWSFYLVKVGKTFNIGKIAINKSKGEPRMIFGAGELKNCYNGITYQLNETEYINPPASYYGRSSAGTISLNK